MDAPANLKQAQRTAAVISGSFIMSVVIYGVVVNVFRVSQAPFEGFVKLAQIELVRIALWAYTAVVLLLIPFMRRVLLTRPPGADERSAAARLSRCAVITNALAETPAVLGFVLVLLNGLYLDFYVLAAVSILLILLYFPRYEAWDEWVKQRP
jgi:hypothetical protein